MPQFDFFSFTTQVFWTLIGYGIIYFFVLNFFLIPFARQQKFYDKLKILLNK